MSEIDDGVIKFNQSDFKKTDPLQELEFKDLEIWRSLLFQNKLIGQYTPSLIGYGNLSKRMNYQSLRENHRPQFVISGTQTGGRPELSGQHYTRVLDFDLEDNRVSVMGPIMASSESLTHASLYEISPQIKAVFHIHHQGIWEKMIQDDLAHTKKETPYGTVEMAREVQDLFKGKTEGLFAMAGHEEGVIAFANGLEKAGQLIIDIYEAYCGPFKK